MFSDNYVITDKHSLTAKQYVSTIETMPWLYTSLYDSQYLPVLSEEISTKLNSLFRYMFPHQTDEPILDDRKVLKIEHVNGEIKKYDCRTEIKYCVLSNNNLVWKHFIHSVGCPEIEDCRSKIDKITSATDEFVTKISGIQYNPDGSFQSISIYDDSYDLDEYSSVEVLSTLNELCKNKPTLMNGVTTFFSQSNKINYRLNLHYPAKFNQRTKKLEKANDKFMQRYLEILQDSNLIDQDQVDYINSIISTKSMFDVEFVIGEDYQIEDIFVYLYKIYEFKDLTAD